MIEELETREIVLHGHRICYRTAGEGPVIVLISSRDGAGCEAVFAGCGARGFIPKAELSGEAVSALAA